jgi:hypothetical protein
MYDPNKCQKKLIFSCCTINPQFDTISSLNSYSHQYLEKNQSMADGESEKSTQQQKPLTRSEAAAVIATAAATMLLAACGFSPTSDSEEVPNKLQIEAEIGDLVVLLARMGINFEFSPPKEMPLVEMSYGERRAVLKTSFDTPTTEEAIYTLTTLREIYSYSSQLFPEGFFDKFGQGGIRLAVVNNLQVTVEGGDENPESTRIRGITFQGMGSNENPIILVSPRIDREGLERYGTVQEQAGGIFTH